MNETLLRAHNKFLRLHGIVYRVISHRLGSCVLSQAEPIKGGETINLVRTRSNLGKELREQVRLGLVFLQP